MDRYERWEFIAKFCKRSWIFRSCLIPFHNFEPYLSGNTLCHLCFVLRSGLLIFIVVISLCLHNKHFVYILRGWYPVAFYVSKKKKNQAFWCRQHIFVIAFHDKLDMFPPFIRSSSGLYTKNTREKLKYARIIHCNIEGYWDRTFVLQCRYVTWECRSFHLCIVTYHIKIARLFFRLYSCLKKYIRYQDFVEEVQSIEGDA